MKKSALVMALLAISFTVSCKKEIKVETPKAPAPSEPPPAPAPDRSAVAESEYDKLKGMTVEEWERLKLFGDVHFDYDKADVRDSERPVLQKNADLLKKYDFMKVTLEGHCDERGSVEYNLALGERRAKAAYDYLISLGVPTVQLRTVSYGKEVPVCTDKTEDCWARNRRAHTTASEKLKK
jgi:peptidoglycan-associated lipoprotein